jgi:septum formation protein
MQAAQVYLASSSPRRKDLLKQLGVNFNVVHPEVDETRAPEETAAAYVKRLALEKAKAGWRLCGKMETRPVLGADTCIVLDGDIIGKPASKEHGLSLLLALGGREHKVYTAVAVVGRRDRKLHEALALNVSDVEFRPLDREECEAYWSTGEPRDKAGAYAIQGKGAAFIRRINGSYSAVVGLPLCETSLLLRSFGVRVI